MPCRFNVDVRDIERMPSFVSCIGSIQAHAPAWIAPNSLQPRPPFERIDIAPAPQLE